MSDAAHDHDHSHAHEHHHHHPHHHDHSDTYEDANRVHFDATAHQYNHHAGAENRAEKLARAMLNTGLFKEKETTVMDFACGTGLISQQLVKAVDLKLIVGVDISQGMVDQYNKAVNNQDIPSEEMKAICVDELRENEKQLEGLTFDVIVCAASYHHFPSIDQVTRVLASYLKPGGSLLVADLLRGESTSEIFPHNVHHIVAHKGGFSEEEMRANFEGAGLKKFAFSSVGKAQLVGNPVELFLARGDK